MVPDDLLFVTKGEVDVCHRLDYIPCLWLSQIDFISMLDFLEQLLHLQSNVIQELFVHVPYFCVLIISQDPLNARYSSVIILCSLHLVYSNIVAIIDVLL